VSFRRPLHSPLAVVALVAATLLVGISPAGIVAAKSPDHAAAVRASDASAPGGRLIVFWKSNRKPNLSMPLIAATRSSSGGARRSVVTAAPGQAAALAARLRADPDVAAVVPDVTFSATDWPAGGNPNDTYYAGKQADLPLIGMPATWATTTGSSSVVVAILDTGTTAGHPDLVGTHFVNAHDFVHFPERSEAVDDDDVGHGTHVTGTIAAQTNNGVGIAGMAPGVSIMPVKVLDEFGTGGLDAILDGIDYARAHGADVINMSLGGHLEPGDASWAQPTIDAAHAAGITIVAAAGNSGNTSVSYPCAFVHVICVGATDNADAHANFSNTNAYVDISAPGVDIVSTVPGGYASYDGTSMATPHVAALAGLVRSAHPGETVDQVEATILSTAIDLGTAGRDNVFGVGRIDAGAAVNLPPPDVIAPAMTGLTAPSIVRSTTRAFNASWAATDNLAVTGFEIKTRNGATGTWSPISSQSGTTRTFSGLAAGSWYIAVRARDAVGHRSAWRQVLAIVPKDGRAWSFSSGTTKRTGPPYIKGTDTTTSRSGARMTIRFTGSAFYLIGTSAARHGRLRVTIDGRSWIVDEGTLRGARATRTTYRVVVFAKALTRRSHIAVITCLGTRGRPTIDVDAVAWRN
jgi:subtilisin family serine protease